MHGKRNIKNSEVILGEKILLSLHSRRNQKCLQYRRQIGRVKIETSVATEQA